MTVCESCLTTKSVASTHSPSLPHPDKKRKDKNILSKPLRIPRRRIRQTSLRIILRRRPARRRSASRDTWNRRNSRSATIDADELRDDGQLDADGARRRGTGDAVGDGEAAGGAREGAARSARHGTAAVGGADEVGAGGSDEAVGRRRVAGRVGAVGGAAVAAVAGGGDLVGDPAGDGVRDEMLERRR